MRDKLLGVGLAGSAVAALCCFTPVLVWLFAAFGLSAYAGYLDPILLPVLLVFLAITGGTRYGGAEGIGSTGDNHHLSGVRSLQNGDDADQRLSVVL